jgi:nitrogen fixation/metabolism regulation signal transduction histidine kinase
MRAFSTPGKLAGILILALVFCLVLVAAGIYFTPLPVWLVCVLAFGLILPFAVWIADRYLRPLTRTLQGLSDGIRSFSDGDFSVRLASNRPDELGELARLYNKVGDILQEERGRLRQRELLLQTALDNSPVALVLVSPLRRVAYSNQEARRLFLGGGHLEGRLFEELLERCPDEMKQVLQGGDEGVFTLAGNDELPETYHLSRRTFRLNRRRHALYLLRRITFDLARQEAEIWKKVIRIISHELNNSLAPISSLAHSGALIASDPEQVHKLEPIYAAIRERVDHLTRFLEGYARFARLPKPDKQAVQWEAWLAGPRKLCAFALDGDLPSDPGHFDPSQLEQVLINLLKNAAEASDGEPEINVRIDRLLDGAVLFRVMDRGRGMSEEVMRKALLPFYSTKKSGTGVGLPLCREIIEAHGGLLRIQAREGGGTVVSFRLPMQKNRRRH